MSFMQRGVFGSTIWLGFMMSEKYLLVVAPLLALLISGSLVFSKVRRSVALPR